MRLLSGLGLILVFILFIGYFFYGLQPTIASAPPVEFKIAKGEGLRSIGARLSQESLVKSITIFKLYSLLSGRAQKFQPGIYELSSSLSVPQIIEILTTSGKNEVTVTIPEGVTVNDIDKILERASVTKAGAITNYPIQSLIGKYNFLSEVDSLEGFLFPDTYRFRLDSEASDVIERMLSNFNLKAWPILAEKMNWYESLILASFLEREVPDFSERQIVSDILLRRLKKDMLLQVDATLSYAKCNGEFIDCPEILVLKSDLTSKSLYNTYQRLGWTPTPISNPGQAAIKAALTPKSNPYWYYLSAAKTKETIFSKTLEEHNLNRAKYL